MTRRSPSQRTCCGRPHGAARRPLREQGDIGSLEVGKKADLIVVDTQRSHLVPTHAHRFSLDP